MKKKNIRWNTMTILALGFMGVILLGGVILYLPICNTQPIRFIDALFTSTTAVCVTGLVTITPATQFTLLGQIILMLLIQVGGLGVVACGTAFFLIMRRRMSVKGRIVIQEAYGLNAPGGVVRMIIRVIEGTLLVEGIGAVLYALQFVPEYGVIKGIWYSVFHSISAFCNAGIDILGSNSFEKYVGNPIINITTVLLIIVSGIGFTVWQDIITSRRKYTGKEKGVHRWFKGLQVHSKVAITMTIILIVVGTVNFFFVEYNNPETMEHLSGGSKFLAALFQSVTTRTAGFATVSQAGLSTESKLVSCLLMFIGGSPGGTAGGIKTTTVAMLLLTCFTVIRGGRDTECFGRKIAADNIRMGMAILLVAFTTLFTGTLIITLLEPKVDFLDLLYETTSAVGTVGLTANLTPTLSDASHIVIMIMMYIGRLGPITLALLFGGMVHRRDIARELPEKRIMVG